MKGLIIFIVGIILFLVCATYGTYFAPNIYIGGLSTFVGFILCLFFGMWGIDINEKENET